MKTMPWKIICLSSKVNTNIEIWLVLGVRHVLLAIMILDIYWFHLMWHFVNINETKKLRIKMYYQYSIFSPCNNLSISACSLWTSVLFEGAYQNMVVGEGKSSQLLEKSILVSFIFCLHCRRLMQNSFQYSLLAVN